MASSVRRWLSRLSEICKEIVNCPFIRGARKRLTARHQPTAAAFGGGSAGCQG